MIDYETLSSCRLWRDKFQAIADDILQGDECYCKEKWGRFDTSYRGNRPGVQDELLKKVEEESERCCQWCGKHRYQIWLDTGWVIHICPICYTRRWWHLFKKKIKKCMKGGGNGGLVYSA